jgi:hypothetical protein
MNIPNMKEWTRTLIALAIFMLAFGIVGRMEFDWESQKNGMPTWEEMR